MKKAEILGLSIAAFIISTNTTSCPAGALDDLKSAAPLAAAALYAPAPETPGTPAPPPSRALDPVLDALNDTLWLDILNRPAHEIPQNKELFSDHNIRYIVKGRLSFDTTPPTLTAETGKVFRVVKYPYWLKLARPKRVCVEGYVRQREDTTDLVVDKLLPPDILEDISPTEAILQLQREPVVMAGNASGYVLGNVSWSMEHDTSGNLARDGNGNLVTVWHSGVKVDAALLEEVYFVKKTALKPLRYGDHGMLMFKFAPGGVTAPDGSSTRSLVVSVDAYYTDPLRMVYSPVAALRGKYQVYYSIQTGERYSDVKFNYNEFNMSTELVLVPYPLLLDGAQKRQLLHNAITKAADDNKGEMYSLFYNSCANSALSLINSVLPRSSKVQEGWLPEIYYRVQVTLPDAMAALLVKRGIAAHPLPDITRDNFSHYLRWN